MILTTPDLPPRTRRAAARDPQVPVLDDALDWELVRALRAGARARRGGAGSARSRCGTSTAPSAGSCRARSRAVTAPRACRGHDRDLVLRLGRTELRRVARPRRDVLAARRDQRLHRQGALGRRRLRAPAGGGAVPRRGEHDRRQHRAVRRDRRACVLPRSRGRALRGAQLRRLRGRRGRRRPRLRVHDRRARRRARTDRPQLRRRHERRDRLRVRPRPALRRAAATSSSSTSSR